jgi:hypothetical protein
MASRLYLLIRASRIHPHYCTGFHRERLSGAGSAASSEQAQACACPLETDRDRTTLVD